jgi:hypothetical protein
MRASESLRFAAASQAQLASAASAANHQEHDNERKEEQHGKRIPGLASACTFRKQKANESGSIVSEHATHCTPEHHEGQERRCVHRQRCAQTELWLTAVFGRQQHPPVDPGAAAQEKQGSVIMTANEVQSGVKRRHKANGH